MTDLEPDLRALFDEKARTIVTSIAAPDKVLRRGRRRQATTALTGGLAAIALIIGSFVGLRAVTRGTDQIPIGRLDEPGDRTATIQGFSVAAPAGWTLQDLSPYANVLASKSTVCSFSGQGSAVGEDPAGGEPAGEPKPSDATPTESCTSSPGSLPAGVPILQLANFDPGLGATVCGFQGDPAIELPSNGAALYVGAFPGGLSTSALQAQCPGAREIGSAGDVGGSVQMTYGTVSVFGPRASAEDVVRVLDAQDALAGPGAAVSVPPAPGPGYVVSAGTSGDISWRLQAGVSFACRGATQCSAQFTMVTTGADGTEHAQSVALPGESAPVIAEAQQIGQTNMVWGTADADVRAISVVNADGSMTSPSTLPWPEGITGVVFDVPQLGGSIWWTNADTPAEVRAQLLDGSTFSTRPGEIGGTTAPPSSSPQTVGQSRLDYRIDGDTTVGTFDAFGHQMQIRARNGRFTISSVQDLRFSYVNGSGRTIDLAGGTLAVSQQNRQVDSIFVEVDGGPVINGRWMPAVDNAGHPGRLWVVALPGEGTGLAYRGDSLPTAISWPSHPQPVVGDIRAAGADRNVSWKVEYATDTTGAPCVIVDQVAGDEAIQPTDCFTPRTSGPPLIMGHGGDRWALLVVSGAPRITVGLRDSSGAKILPQCIGATTEGTDTLLGGAVCVAVVRADTPIDLRTIELGGTDKTTTVTIPRNGAYVSGGA